MSLIADEHRAYLTDRARLDAFRAAMAERIRPGDVIVDLGAGTGILGLLACQAGAGRVYAIESTGLIEIAKRLARANGFGARIVHLKGRSTDVELPERADGIVCDQIGHFGFEAGLFDALADARRFLRPGGWLMPQAIDLHAAPVSAPDIAGRVRFWRDSVDGLQLSAASDWASSTGYPLDVAEEQLLGPAVAIARAGLSDDGPARLMSSVTMSIARDGTLDGIAGWFTATLSPGVTMTNAPGDKARIARRNLVLPLGAPVDVQAGDAVDLRLQILPVDGIVAWRGMVRTSHGETAFSQSNVSAMLLDRENLHRLRPDSAPRLTEQGAARLTVLQLCDGTRSLADVEREARARHPQLLRDREHASAFVARLVSRYCR